MKNVIRVLSLIAMTGTALAAASNASFAAAHRPHMVRHTPVAAKHVAKKRTTARKPVAAKAPVAKRVAKKHKKVVINLERGKGRKARTGKIGRAAKKPAVSGPIVTQS
jgi:hypothetical protein